MSSQPNQHQERRQVPLLAELSTTAVEALATGTSSGGTLTDGNLTSGAGRCLRKVLGMFKEGPRYKDSPAKAGGEGWLYSEQQQKLRYFAPNNFFAQ